jgi:hypothetical protein
VLVLVLAIAGVLAGLVYLFSTLIALLFETGLASAIDPQTLSERSKWAEDRHPMPKILHQTWKNETVPEMWAIAQYSCMDLHPDYQYIV